MVSPGLAGQGAGATISGAASRVAPVVGAPLTEALRLASLAPSAHNAQPWLVIVHERRRWTLSVAPDRHLSVLDPGDRGAVIAIGAFLENLSIAGRALGYRVEAEHFGRQVDDAAIVSLRLTPVDRQGDTEAIVQRRTLRRPFARRAVTRGDLGGLCLGLDELHWIPAECPAGRRVRDIVVGATESQASREEARLELADWLRRPGTAAEACGDGLTPAELELKGLAGWLAWHGTGQSTLWPLLLQRVLVDRAARLSAACGGWLILASPDSSIESLVVAGRRLERLLLRCRGLGLGIQPMSQPLQEAGWRQDLERDSGTRGFVRMLLRVGYAGDWPSGSGPRLAPDVFTHLLC